MTGTRKTILIGMLAGAVFAALWIYLGLKIWASDVAPIDTMAARLGFAIQYEIFVGLMLLAGVGTVARQRFFSDHDIDGSAPEQGSSVELNIRYIENTSEQVVLAFIAHLSLAVVIPIHLLHIIPLLVSLFVVARICFWIGYHISPAARAMGFAATFYPTVVAYVYVVVKVLSGAAAS